jgi:hypothetical protein
MPRPPSARQVREALPSPRLSERRQTLQRDRCWRNAFSSDPFPVQTKSWKCEGPFARCLALTSSPSSLNATLQAIESVHEYGEAGGTPQARQDRMALEKSVMRAVRLLFAAFIGWQAIGFSVDEALIGSPVDVIEKIRNAIESNFRRIPTWSATDRFHDELPYFLSVPSLTPIPEGEAAAAQPRKLEPRSGSGHGERQGGIDLQPDEVGMSSCRVQLRLATSLNASLAEVVVCRGGVRRSHSGSI